MKSVKSITACTLAVGATLSLSSKAAIIYQDDFNFTGALNGRTPIQTTGANWTADPSWTANGSSVNPTTANRSANLPFTAVNGMIYELTATMSNASGSTTTWISLGFHGSGTPAVNSNFTSGGIATAILRDDGNNQFYAGSGASNTSGNLAIPGFAANTFYEYKIVLNTMGANWTYDVYRDGTQLDVNGSAAGLTYTWAVNPSINSIMLSSNTASGSARYDSFSFVAIPEPSSMLCLVTAGALGLVRRRR